MKNTKTAILASAALAAVAFLGNGLHAQLIDTSPRKLAKVDIDADFNYDGVIDNYDPTDNGSVQITPPGLYVGAGEVTKIVLRIRPYREDDKGEAAIVLSVSGINRAKKSGEFDSFEEEQASAGQVRVWLEPTKKTLILDSTNPSMRSKVWTAQDGIIPSQLFLEGVKTSGQEGDVKLLLKCESVRKAFETFETTFDHLLFTIIPEPRQKASMNTDIWSSTKK